MSKYAFIQEDNSLGMIIEADSLELAQEVSSSVYGVKEVISVEDKENANLATPGASWDGEKFIAIPDSNLEDKQPTNRGPEETWNFSASE